MLKPAAAGLALLALCLLPRDASAVALAGVSTSIGLAAALLALLAAQGGATLTAAGALALGGALLVLAALAHFAWQRRARAPLRRHGVPPVLAQAACGAADQALLTSAREHFVRLQRAWDHADLDSLRVLATDGMFDELQAQLAQRGPGQNRTDVLALDAHLIVREQFGSHEVASIEFSGLVRESRDCGAVPFREVWMLARANEPGDAEVWRLARQQSLL